MKSLVKHLQAESILLVVFIVFFTLGTVAAMHTPNDPIYEKWADMERQTSKYPVLHFPQKQYYISFVEDISAAKPGQNLSAQFSGDTLQIGYPEDYPLGMKVQLLPN